MAQGTNLTPIHIGMAYRQYKARQITFYIASLTAFLMSSYFMITYFAGDLKVHSWTLEQWKQAIASLGITFVMTAFQFVLYSEGKHKRATALTILATLVAVFFAFLTEIGQGMEREEQRVAMRSIESPTYQAMLERIGTLGSVPIAANPYADDIARAEMKLARCEERRTRGLEQHCEQSTARLAAYQQQAADYVQQLQQNHANTTTALFQQAKAMEMDANNHHPLVKLLINWFGIASVSGNFLISLLIIGAFEFAFHYLGGKYAEAREVLVQAGYDLSKPPAKTQHPAPENPPKSSHDAAAIDTVQVISDAHYSAWKIAIQNGDITPAKAAAQKFIWRVSKQNVDDQHVLSATETARIWENWQTRAVEEGVLVENPKYKAGNRQARYQLVTV